MRIKAKYFKIWSNNSFILRVLFKPLIISQYKNIFSAEKKIINMFKINHQCVIFVDGQDICIKPNRNEARDRKYHGYKKDLHEACKADNTWTIPPQMSRSATKNSRGRTSTSSPRDRQPNIRPHTHAQRVTYPLKKRSIDFSYISQGTTR